MAATFNWQIAQCERTIATGGIVLAHWRCDAEETVGAGDGAVTHHASSYGAQSFTPDASASDFIPYESVTEANVKAWLWAEGVNQEDIEASLQSEIDALKEPTTGTGVPW